MKLDKAFFKDLNNCHQIDYCLAITTGKHCLSHPKLGAYLSRSNLDDDLFSSFWRISEKRLPSTMSRYVNIFFCSFKIIKQRKSISQYNMWSKRNLGPNKVKLTKYLDVIHYFFPVSKLVGFVYFTSVIVVTLSSPNHSLSVIFRKLLRHWTRLSQEVTFHRPDPPQLWLQWEWNCMFLVDWVEIVDGWMIYTLLILVCVI